MYLYPFLLTPQSLILELCYKCLHWCLIRFQRRSSTELGICFLSIIDSCCLFTSLYRYFHDFLHLDPATPELEPG